MEAYAITNVKASYKTLMPCWRCHVPRDSLNDPLASFPSRIAAEIYHHLDKVSLKEPGVLKSVRWLKEHSIRHRATGSETEVGVALGGRNCIYCY
jgi:hypothetical protein